MKLRRAAGTMSLLAFTAVAYPLAFAQDAGWYGGLNIGQSKAKIDDARITSGLIGGGFTSAALTNDDRDTGYKVFGGYQFNKNFSLEGGYFDLGRFGFVANTVPLGSLTGNIKIKGVNLDLVGMLPLTEKFSAFARLGVSNA
ncbi:MAG: outer membrane beta-barrel protein, partial [Usitatibacteraceae bacterium]